jgi:hypothetical protein
LAPLFGEREGRHHYGLAELTSLILFVSTLLILSRLLAG